MTNEWKKTKREVGLFRQYVDDLPASAKSKASYCYLITREEINRLLDQKGNGDSLDGIRIYLGAEMIDNAMVPNVHVVACEKDGDGGYHDYNIGNEIPDNNELTAISAPAMLGKTRPCPTWCSQLNFLNA
ncbi:MAG TPA: hypothetical protein VH396_11840 [Chitinophagaceae bacterium]|jgi:hypothetical protein